MLEVKRTIIERKKWSFVTVLNVVLLFPFFSSCDLEFKVLSNVCPVDIRNSCNGYFSLSNYENLKL